MKRVTIVVLAGIAGGVVLSVIFLALPWFPSAASSQANRVDALFWAITYVSFVIFGVVIAVMGYCLWKFRRKGPDDMRDGRPLHGNTALEIFWTAIPFAIVIFFGAWGAYVLRADEKHHKGELVVIAHGQQFSWSFQFPNDGNFTTPGSFEVPLGRPIVIKVRSNDVIHSFFVPNWRVKADAVPGNPNDTFVTPDKLGTFPVICAELCGSGHSTMRGQVTVVTPTQFAAWVQQQRKATAGQSPGAQVFAQNGCGGCHTLAAAHATGTVGPPLEVSDLQKSAGATHENLASYIRDSIVSPNKYIVPGYPANTMPPNFGQTLTPTQIDALVKYLASGGKQ